MHFTDTHLVPDVDIESVENLEQKVPTDLLASLDNRLQQTIVCQRSSDPFYVVTYYIKYVTTPWTYIMFIVYNTPNQHYVENNNLSSLQLYIRHIYQLTASSLE